MANISQSTTIIETNASLSHVFKLAICILLSLLLIISLIPCNEAYGRVRTRGGETPRVDIPETRGVYVPENLKKSDSNSNETNKTDEGKTSQSSKATEESNDSETSSNNSQKSKPWRTHVMIPDDDDDNDDRNSEDKLFPTVDAPKELQSAKTGWNKLNGSWYYIYQLGRCATGVWTIDNETYWLDSHGIMQTGWQKQGSKWAYFGDDGKLLTGWQYINDKWYYLGKYGVMKTGWIQDKGTWYYLGSDGAMQTNTIVDGWVLGSDGCGTELTAEPLPANGEILSGYNQGNAGVEVSASDANVFVKVKSTNGDTVASFFVRKNSTAQIYVNPGTYSIQFASGDTWYGTLGCFGSKTSYGQDKSVSLGYGDIVCYSLKLSSNGNFSMKSLDPDEF